MDDPIDALIRADAEDTVHRIQKAWHDGRYLGRVFGEIWAELKLRREFIELVLTHRFGPLTPEQQHRLHHSSGGFQLRCYQERVLTVQSVDDLFADPDCDWENIFK
jgi:hypothetical protein